MNWLNQFLNAFSIQKSKLDTLLDAQDHADKVIAWRKHMNKSEVSEQELASHLRYMFPGLPQEDCESIARTSISQPKSEVGGP